MLLNYPVRGVVVAHSPVTREGGDRNPRTGPFIYDSYSVMFDDGIWVDDMGYNTQYKLTIEPETDEVIKYLENNEDLYEYGAWCDNLEPCKWYDHENDMRGLSRLFPNILFTLYGNGEEKDDIWIIYAKGGKSQLAKAQVFFEGFDESKLR